MFFRELEKIEAIKRRRCKSPERLARFERLMDFLFKIWKERTDRKMRILFEKR